MDRATIHRYCVVILSNIKVTDLNFVDVVSLSEFRNIVADLDSFSKKALCLEIF